MEHMKKLLQKRISEIHDPIQGMLLQDVLVDVFGELLQYSEGCFASLEAKIDSELQDSSDTPYIYMGICRKEGIDSASRSLFEVKRKGDCPTGYLGTMFLACDYLVIRQCLGRNYRAKVETDKGDFQTTVRLSYCNGYLKVFEQLHHHFIANQKQWHTINCPYLYKLLDVVEQEDSIPKEASIKKVGIDLGEFSKFVMDDMVLVWNLSKETYKPHIDISVTSNASFYTHKILVQDMDACYLAIPEKEEQFHTVHYENGIVVRTQEKAHESLDLLKIGRMDMKKDHTSLAYPLQTNHRDMRHVDRQALLHQQFLCTKGEVERILSSYDAFQDFELAGICPDIPGEADVIDMNPFIRTHSFLKQKRKIAIIFHPKDDTDIFRYEKMFFLLSELQLYTQEYEWRGVLE